MKVIYGLALALLVACTSDPDFDMILRNGMIYDGSGSPPYTGDIAIQHIGSRIVGIDIGGVIH